MNFTQPSGHPGKHQPVRPAEATLPTLVRGRRKSSQNRAAA
jgi:hypothetical protein